MGKGETGYIASNIQQEQHGFSLLGGGKISEALLFTSDQNNGTWSLSQESCTTYIIHSIFLWFGIIVGVLVIVALFAFALYALRVALRQSNRAALLLGSVCSLSIMLLDRQCGSGEFWIWHLLHHIHSISGLWAGELSGQFPDGGSDFMCLS